LDRVASGTRSLRGSHPQINNPVSLRSRESLERCSALSDGSLIDFALEFDFDDQVVSSLAYRRALLALTTSNKEIYHQSKIVEEDLIDLSGLDDVEPPGETL
jgi:hypothetical protein